MLEDYCDTTPAMEEMIARMPRGTPIPTDVPPLTPDPAGRRCARCNEPVPYAGRGRPRSKAGRHG